MASQYFAILTDYGTTAFANALSSKQPLQLTTFAVGDGNGQVVTPTANRTALAREKHRAPVSAVSLDPRNNKQVVVELTIPENVGGFYIREMGVFDNQNKLVAYANCPESFKPTESSGSGKVQVLRMILKVSSSDAVTLSIDHSVIFVTRQQLNPKTITAETQNGFDESGHTHEIDRANTEKAGIVQLSNDDNSDDETKAPTLKAIKKLKGLYDGLRRLLDNYIPNSKKSNAVNSASSDTVATSLAAKTAYDKAVEAKNAADNANNNANRRAFGLALSNEDLNSFTASGIYGQSLNSNSTSDRHYPIQQAGMLIVTGSSGYGAQQLYTPFDVNHIYARGRNANQGWNDWKRIDGLDKVSKSGDTMSGMLGINSSGEVYRIGGNNWSKKIHLSGDSVIGNEICAIGFNNNGGLHLGGKPNAAEFNASLDESRLWTKGDVVTKYGASLNSALMRTGGTMTGNLIIDTTDSLLKGQRNGVNKYAVGLRNSTSNDVVVVNYTDNTALELLANSVYSNKTLVAPGMILDGSDWAGFNLKNLSGRYVRFEGNPHSAESMLTIVYREANGTNINTVSLRKKGGTVALLDDIKTNEQLLWQGSSNNAITVNLPADTGTLFVCVTKSTGAGTINDMWLSAPIGNCNNTHIGDQDAGGASGDYNFSMAVKLTKSGRALTLTPSGARKPVIKKVVVGV
ncbi:hypothetical protein D3M74_06385 [Rodentibacter pneumotropicus]|uniref:Phage tail fibre protein N-terminal domain-containing protein n=4 Tax=Rodentibacter pneumotropicus TaxID=758 RepID=A0A4S2QLK6_9PAST|nr:MULTISPECIES: phage tail protein [Pasteurellaceae]TGY50821.1 hypothetical protein E5343_00255 [Pasteurella caecimuris]THA00951.1 hypothetical protein D3M74_06385 [Rodentibacter pneumotropicus]THA17247.1 hypothetical protein D3M76_01855 [Rodentibacter pneumotropicus]